MRAVDGAYRRHRGSARGGNSVRWPIVGRAGEGNFREAAWGKRSCRWSALAGVALRSPAREAVQYKGEATMEATGGLTNPMREPELDVMVEELKRKESPSSMVGILDDDSHAWKHLERTLM